MLERAVGKLGKGAGRLIDRATTKINEVAETRAKPEPPTLATTTFATPHSPHVTTRLIRDERREGGALAGRVEIAWPDGVEPGRWTRHHTDGRYVTVGERHVEERWFVDPKNTPPGQVRHELQGTKRGAGLDWPDHDYETQLRRRDDAMAAALAGVSSAPINRADRRDTFLEEAESHWSGTVGGRHVVIDRRFKMGLMRAAGMDDLKLVAVDGSIDGERFELRWDRGWVAGTIAGRPLHVESVSDRPRTSGTFNDLAVARENHGATISVGATTFDVVWADHGRDGDLITWDADATGLDPAVLYVVREACASSTRDWA